jgi:competence protein ComEC
MAGFSLPTQRALVMLLLYWFSRLLGIRLSAKRLLLCTLFIVVIISPFSLFTASFWLSFYAVTIIFLSLWRFRYWLNSGPTFWRFVKGLFIIQCSLTLMLIPISAVFFQQVSLVSFLANIIAVPWMSAVSIPCTLLSVILMPFSEPISQWLMTLSLYSLTLLWWYLAMLSELPSAIIPVSWDQQSVLFLAGVSLFTLIYLSPLKYTKAVFKLITIIVTLVLISYFYLSAGSHRTNHNQISHKKTYDISTPWQVIFFDVGQGLSVLIKRNDHGILYDTGAAYPSGFNMSEAVILPYLQYIGMNRLDKVILSHSDNDHAGGLAMLESKVIIDEVISNDSAITKKPVSSCYQGNIMNWQGLTISVLSPTNIAKPALIALPLAPLETADIKARKTSKEKGTKQKNDDSCVLLISDRTGNSALLTGDISSKLERKLMANYPQLDVDILQVPHHGSKTSSSLAFIKQLSPEFAVVSAGYLNRWYMPVASVSQRYLDEGVQLINSADVGQVIITIEGENIEVLNYAEDLRPFWFSH